MPLRKQRLIWPLSIALSIAALNLAHDLRWPAQQDDALQLRQAAAQIARFLPDTSAVAIQSNGRPEGDFQLLRYFLIPRPLAPDAAHAKHLLLLSDSAHKRAAIGQLMRLRPELNALAAQQRGNIYLALYKSSH